jgi:hypothetical protein
MKRVVKSSALMIVQVTTLFKDAVNDLDSIVSVTGK